MGFYKNVFLLILCILCLEGFGQNSSKHVYLKVTWLKGPDLANWFWRTSEIERLFVEKFTDLSYKVISDKDSYKKLALENYDNFIYCDVLCYHILGGNPRLVLSIRDGLGNNLYYEQKDKMMSGSHEDTYKTLSAKIIKEIPSDKLDPLLSSSSPDLLSKPISINLAVNLTNLTYSTIAEKAISIFTISDRPDSIPNFSPSQFLFMPSEYMNLVLNFYAFKDSKKTLRKTGLKAEILIDEYGFPSLKGIIMPENILSEREIKMLQDIFNDMPRWRPAIENGRRVESSIIYTLTKGTPKPANAN